MTSATILKTRTFSARWLAAGLVLAPVLATAHPGHVHPGEEDEFDAMTAGFLHSFGGSDHLFFAVAAAGILLALLRPQLARICGGVVLAAGAALFLHAI